MSAHHDGQTSGAFHHFNVRSKKDMPELTEGIKDKTFKDMTPMEKETLSIFIKSLVLFVDDEDLDYQVAEHYLSQLHACQMSGAPREGFDFWYARFQAIPSLTSTMELNAAASVLLGTGPFNTSMLDVVAIGMMSFCNCLRQRHYMVTRWRNINKGGDTAGPPIRLSPSEAQKRRDGFNDLLKKIINERRTTLSRLDAQAGANARRPTPTGGE